MPTAYSCIQALFPYAYEKEEQMRLVLSSTPKTWLDIKDKLNALKGRRYVKYGKKTADDSEIKETLNEADLDEIVNDVDNQYPE